MYQTGATRVDKRDTCVARGARADHVTSCGGRRDGGKTRSGQVSG